MQRRFWVSGLMLALGTSLLVAAGLASPANSTPNASAKTGGTLRVVRTVPFSHVDPSRSYFSHDWGLEFATGCKLYNFGENDAKIHPEVATALPTVSNNGKTYTFTIRSGKAYRFANDGKVVTAKNFAWALNRDLLWQPSSPAADFINDPAATQIVGAQAVLDKKSKAASGVQVKGNKLIVRLTKPSPAFVSQLTMPFFQAMPLSWPITEIRETDLGSATSSPGNTCGPYHLTSSVRTQFAVIQRNKYYKGPRKGKVASVRWTIGVPLSSEQLQVQSNQQDLGGFPPEASGQLSRQYGPSGRFKRFSQAVTWYWSLNTTAKAFKNNVPLRQAVNYAINRTAMSSLFGQGAAKPTDQLLPPTGMPGFKDWKIYPFKPNVAKGKKLAAGHLRDKSVVLYTASDAPFPALATLAQSNLKPLGLNVDIKTFDRTVEEEKVERKGEPFDMALSGWGSDYPDPYDFINILLYGNQNIKETANVNTSYFDNPKWNKRMEQAAALPVGSKRYNAYAKLDHDINAGPAPIAPMANNLAQIFMSNRVKKYVFQPVYGVTNWVATELK
jgi:peptide/nickel transport system substrate-binding protein